MKVAIVGPGPVGTTLGSMLYQKYPVRYGSRHPGSAKIQRLLMSQPGTSADTVHSAVAWADLVVLTTPGAYDDHRLHELAASLGPHIRGKVLVDVTNPLSPYPAVETRCWAAGGISGGEALQALLPGTHVFKAFNTIPMEHMAAGDGSTLSPGQQLSMLYAGGPEGKEHVEAFISGVGFRPEYVGPIRYARNLEALAELVIHVSVPGVAMPGVGSAAHWGRNVHLQVLRRQQAE